MWLIFKSMLYTCLPAYAACLLPFEGMCHLRRAAILDEAAAPKQGDLVEGCVGFLCACWVGSSELILALTRKFKWSAWPEGVVIYQDFFSGNMLIYDLNWRDKQVVAKGLIWDDLVESPVKSCRGWTPRQDTDIEECCNPWHGVHQIRLLAFQTCSCFS